ncbi:MAG TPA: hypothetical protein ENK66_03285 [Arcobacter sp.]|nr:hypothetical protein [Arcobacter sp.]
MGFTGGFVGTLVNGGSFGQALRNGAIGGVTGAVTAGFTQGIGDLGAWMTNAGNYSAGTAFATKTVLHGALSGFMSAARGGKWSAGFYAGAVGTMLSPFARTGNYYGNVASNAIISGTVSALSGGKFANGAIMGAFRYMFNDALASHLTTNEERESYILERARLLSTNGYVSQEYRRKLVEFLRNGNIEYRSNEYERIQGTKGFAHIFGVTDAQYSSFDITGRAWSDFGDNSFMIQVQVDKTILHEMTHVLLRNNGHPSGFENPVHNMMEQIYPGYRRH